MRAARTAVAIALLVVALAAQAALALPAPRSANRPSAPVQSAFAVGQYEKLEVTVPLLLGPTFGDVPWDHWAFYQIEACGAAGIVAGYYDGSYRPTETVNRAQMAVFLARALAGGDERVPSGPAVPSFRDVPAEHWAFRYVEYAGANGIAEGYEGGLYQPDFALDRGQMAAFIARAIATPIGEAGLKQYVPPTSPSFPDVPTTFWAFRYIEYIKAAGVAAGYLDGRYHPETICTRDQMAVYVARAFSLPLKLRGNYQNPFDPQEIDVQGEFHAPSGRIIRVPGFCYHPYQRFRDHDGTEVLIPNGDGSFKVRFAWGEIGDYTFRITAREPSGSQTVASGSFRVVASENRGYIRPSPTAPLHLQFESGDSYFAIGENMCWPDVGGTYDYDRWMPKLALQGGNSIRLWVFDISGNPLALERLPSWTGDGNGLGRYDQGAAWRADYTLDLAERLGIRALVCIEGANSLDESGALAAWDRNPYNSDNGGPCASPYDFFEDDVAKRLFQQRLRYLVARWGYATSLLGWELSNEVDIVTRGYSWVLLDWHREMGDYLRALDPWLHPITTSFSGAVIAAECPIVPEIFSLEPLDLMQSHYYDSHDMAWSINQVCRQQNAAYGKPHIVGEFGVGWIWESPFVEEVANYLHDGLWASMLAPAAGTAMEWSWTYVEDNDLYHHFSPVAAFAADVDWVRERYHLASIASLRYRPGQEPSGPLSLTIATPAYGCRDESPFNQPNEFTVGNDGVVTNFDRLSWGQNGTGPSAQRHNPATFHVNYPVPGKFEVIVWGVSGWGGAALAISLDGAQALVAGFPDCVPDETGVTHQYDGIYGIDVPAGGHTITVENIGTDICQVDYRVTNYVTSPNLLVLAVSNASSGLVWVQNRQHTWWNHHLGLTTEPVNASEITIGGFTPGDYRIEQWDTYAGQVASAADYTSTDGTIVIATPPGLTTDVAYKVRKR